MYHFLVAVSYAVAQLFLKPSWQRFSRKLRSLKFLVLFATKRKSCFVNSVILNVIMFGLFEKELQYEWKFGILRYRIKWDLPTKMHCNLHSVVPLHSDFMLLFWNVVWISSFIFQCILNIFFWSFPLMYKFIGLQILVFSKIFITGFCTL